VVNNIIFDSDKKRRKRKRKQSSDSSDDAQKRKIDYKQIVLDVTKEENDYRHRIYPGRTSKKKTKKLPALLFFRKLIHDYFLFQIIMQFWMNLSLVQAVPKIWERMSLEEKLSIPTPY